MLCSEISIFIFTDIVSKSMVFGHTILVSGHKELIISNTNGFIVLSLTDYCSITPHIKPFTQ